LLLSAVLALPFASDAHAADPEADLKQAAGLYADGQFQEAAKLLEQARAAAKEPKLRTRILLQLGITHAVLGNEAQAKQSFEAALEIDPTLALDPESVKPSILIIFKAAKGAPKGWLSVRSTPPGAEVLVDGKVVGTTPLERSRVVAGQRAIEVSLSGHYSDKRSLAITENQESRFEVALAVRPSPVRPGTHPFAASLHLGGAIAAKGDIATMFVLGQEIGVHFSRRASGFFLGLALSESFGSKNVVLGYNAYGNAVSADSSFFFLTAGAKLAWDIQLASSVGLYLTPILMAGYAYLHQGAEGYEGLTAHAGAIQPGLELKLILIDRLLLTLRPFGLEFLVGSSDDLPDGYLMRYHLSLGIGGSF
jgi:tetratricopeptide (TPR) repeat protein